jgi:hypothetical protein
MSGAVHWAAGTRISAAPAITSTINSAAHIVKCFAALDRRVLSVFIGISNEPADSDDRYNFSNRD